MTTQSVTDPVDIADLVQAAHAYLMRSDLIRLDRESVQAAHRLRCMLSQLAAGADVPLPESRKAGGSFHAAPRLIPEHRAPSPAGAALIQTRKVSAAP